MPSRAENLTGLKRTTEALVLPRKREEVGERSVLP